MSDSSGAGTTAQMSDADARRSRGRPRLVHGLLGLLAVGIIAGAVAGLSLGPAGARPAGVAVVADEPAVPEAAARDQQRETPSSSPSEKDDKKDDKPQDGKDENYAAEQESESSDSAPQAAAGCDDHSGNQAIACGMLGDFGFDTDQMSCLDPLWDHESGWNEKASNPSSGAYGIPQALPGDKMASSGGDWSSNPETQIDWGLGYISDRYGDPCGAWSFWQSNNYY